ncbi:MAG: cytidylate kinase-like family protein [Chloroflexi bacterium]|jgi:cytidylate kinase|nr:cytidylate kinase-like family protein [Chloroflexota bacterium]MBA3797338.1 cytidylate kinase-like family protein [Chloroflexota bacterium]
MPIITISRQFGALGKPIGLALAERFEAEFVDRGIVAAVAARSGIPESEAEGYDERLPSLWQRIAAALATSSPEIAMPPLPSDVSLGTAIHERLPAITRAVIVEAAESGNAVILGRGAAFILKRRPDVLHVQLHAPLEARVRYLMTRVEEMPIDAKPDEASLRDLCESFDRARTNYIRRLFGRDWLDATCYDLALDTGRFGLTASVDLIEAAARELAGGEAEMQTPETPRPETQPA